MNRIIFLIAISIGSSCMAQNLSLNDVDIPPRLENACLENNTVDCFTISLSRFVNQNLDFTRLSRKQVAGKAYVQFTITKDGEVRNTRARSKSDILAEVVTETIRKLPIAEAAQKDGVPTEITYTLPVSFNTLTIGKNEIVYDGDTSHDDFADLTEAAHAPKFQNYEKEFEAISRNIKRDLREHLKQMNFKKKDLDQMKVSFVITSNIKLRNVVEKLLKRLTVLEPGLDKNNRPMNLRVIYNYEEN